MKEEVSKKKQEKAIDKILMADMDVDKEELKKLKKKLLKAGEKPERGIETWFRLASKNLYARLQIVDTKANILITANAIIISMVLGTLYHRLDDDPHLIYAVGGLVVTNVISITFAILATIPQSWMSNQGKEEVAEVDLMNFDDFRDMPLDSYRDSVLKVIESGETLYPSIITDIHRLGINLARKYKLIRSSYLVFLYGIIISVILFTLCHALF